jgi:prepilin-type N-terminal cleavage/methylation domain-containing protein
MTPRRHASGFTLIELLAASALAALLMLVLFQVIGSLGRSRAALERAAASEVQSATQTAWKADLLDLIRWDVANAADVNFKPGVLTLTSHGALDRQSLAAKQEPVMIVYAIEHRGNTDCLVRRQVRRDGSSGDAGWSELVCANVTRFEMSPVRSPGIQSSSSSSSSSSAARVRIEGPAGVVLDDVIVVK